MKQSDKDLSKQLNKNLTMVFFNSVEDMNVCYGTNDELPEDLSVYSDFVCYEIEDLFEYEYICQYKFEKGGVKHFSHGDWSNNLDLIDTEGLLHKYDRDEYDGRCFVYVRVNKYLRKHIEKTVIGCEFTSKYHLKNSRTFVAKVELVGGELFVYDNDDYSNRLDDILLYPDDDSEPVPYKEWIKLINKEFVEV